MSPERIAAVCRGDDLLWWGLRTVPGLRRVCAFSRGIWHSVCERLAEWLLTIWLLNWGVTLAYGGTFEAPAFAVLKSWASIETWSLFCLIGGGGRLMLLILNGGWRKSPHFRVLAALGTVPFWVAVAYGFQLSGTNTTGTGAYYACIVAEIVSMYRATSEAGWNDGRAAHQGNRG
ncbi:hypothetical protein FP2506_03585 [Fulvimarina pelagi HTCC2506]|uniref:Uncharacterized protein n=2 Tax=Fulvimarina pelagi TaxID=217511 RepID=Q0FZK1_9HYPH|nr:hypothetical protein [Fulvimarina pelagi]EAU40277.1 hypothetical protein FP2506_03585 [Fulvimarina pelagi HTCC2506]BAT31317.1 hypothetical protein [Fulvimarina pelagi]